MDTKKSGQIGQPSRVLSGSHVRLKENTISKTMEQKDQSLNTTGISSAAEDMLTLSPHAQIRGLSSHLRKKTHLTLSDPVSAMQKVLAEYRSVYETLKRKNVLFAQNADIVLAHPELAAQFMKYVDFLNNPRACRDILPKLYIHPSINKSRKDILEDIDHERFGSVQATLLQAIIFSVVRFYRIGLTIEDNMQYSDAYQKQDRETMHALEQVAREKVGKNNSTLDAYIGTKQEFKRTVDVYTVLEGDVDSDPLVTFDENNVRVFTYTERGKTPRHQYREWVHMSKERMFTQKEEMSREELHHHIVEHLLSQAEAGNVPKQPQLLLTGGMPGAGKSQAVESLVQSHTFHGEGVVTVDPDLIKEYLPEYYRNDGSFDDKTVHEESAFLAKRLLESALAKGYHILFDSSMKDSFTSEGKPKKYSDFMSRAQEKGYQIKVGFVWDKGEGWYRNSIFRPRAMQPSYLEYLDCLDVLAWYFEQDNVDVEMRVFINTLKEGFGEIARSTKEQSLSKVEVHEKQSFDELVKYISGKWWK